jgi:hypothetical protein
MTNPFKVGDKVKFTDGDEREFTVYQIYSDTELSLGLYDYPDVEQDWQTNINKIKKI